MNSPQAFFPLSKQRVAQRPLHLTQQLGWNSPPGGPTSQHPRPLLLASALRLLSERCDRRVCAQTRLSKLLSEGRRRARFSICLQHSAGQGSRGSWGWGHQGRGDGPGTFPGVLGWSPALRGPGELQVGAHSLGRGQTASRPFAASLGSLSSLGESGLLRVPT